LGTGGAGLDPGEIDDLDALQGKIHEMTPVDIAGRT